MIQYLANNITKIEINADQFTNNLQSNLQKLIRYINIPTFFLQFFYIINPHIFRTIFFTRVS